MAATGGGYLREGQGITCASSECLRDSVLGSADFVALEALVEPSRTADASVALYRFRTKAYATLLARLSLFQVLFELDVRGHTRAHGCNVLPSPARALHWPTLC